LDCYLALRAAEPEEEVFSPEGLLYYGTIGSFYDLQYYRAAFGEDISLVGIPGQTGLLWSDSAYAINRNSPHQEEAWNILRQLLLPEYQQEHSSGFPTNQEALQALAQAVQNREPTEAEWAFSAFPLDVTLEPVSAADTEMLLAWMDTAQLQPTGLYGSLWLQSSTLLTQAIEAQPQGSSEELALWMQSAYEQEESE
jgi:spermidine/putrescine-binding protein